MALTAADVLQMSATPVTPVALLFFFSLLSFSPPSLSVHYDFHCSFFSYDSHSNNISVVNRRDGGPTHGSVGACNYLHLFFKIVLFIIHLLFSFQYYCRVSPAVRTAAIYVSPIELLSLTNYFFYAIFLYYSFVLRILPAGGPWQYAHRNREYAAYIFIHLIMIEIYYLVFCFFHFFFLPFEI